MHAKLMCGFWVRCNRKEYTFVYKHWITIKRVEICQREERKLTKKSYAYRGQVDVKDNLVR